MAKKVKAKTHKASKKVLNIRQSGSITKARGGVLHKTGKKSGKVNRDKRKGSELSASDLKRIKNVI